MVRELTKSALSFSWALSLLGLKQAVSLGRSGQRNGGDLFSPVTQMAVEQLDESMKGIYRSGDNLQSRMVDMAFSWMSPANWFNPGSWMQSAANFTQTAGGCCRQNAGASQSQSPMAGASSAHGGTNAPISNASAAAGWGPMPGSES